MASVVLKDILEHVFPTYGEFYNDRTDRNGHRRRQRAADDEAEEARPRHRHGGGGTDLVEQSQHGEGIGGLVGERHVPGGEAAHGVGVGTHGARRQLVEVTLRPRHRVGEQRPPLCVFAVLVAQRPPLVQSFALTSVPEPSAEPFGQGEDRGAGEAAGEWLGSGAAELGLSGKLDASELRAIMEGVDPHGGEALLGGGPGRPRSVPGFDLTFSAPKSVSLLFAFGDPYVRSAVIAAHERAVRAALSDYLESHAVGARRGTDGVEKIAGVFPVDR